MGFANVRVEPFDMPVWVRGRESAEITRTLPAADGRCRAGQQRSTGPTASKGKSSPSTASMR